MERRKIDACLRGRGCRDGNLAPASLAVSIQHGLRFDSHKAAARFDHTADFAGRSAFNGNSTLDSKRSIGASIKNNLAVCRLDAVRFDQAFDIDNPADGPQR